jgi:hypothetical protein
MRKKKKESKNNIHTWAKPTQAEVVAYNIQPNNLPSANNPWAKLIC